MILHPCLTVIEEEINRFNSHRRRNQSIAEQQELSLAMPPQDLLHLQKGLGGLVKQKTPLYFYHYKS